MHLRINFKISVIALCLICLFLLLHFPPTLLISYVIWTSHSSVVTNDATDRPDHPVLMQKPGEGTQKLHPLGPSDDFDPTISRVPAVNLITNHDHVREKQDSLLLFPLSGAKQEHLPQPYTREQTTCHSCLYELNDEKELREMIAKLQVTGYAAFAAEAYRCNL